MATPAVADEFGSFTITGNPFDPDTAARLLRHVYSAGNTREPATAYRAFRKVQPESGTHAQEARPGAGSRWPQAAA